MGVKLYTLDWSPPVRATMMACDIFDVPFEKIEVNLMKKEHLTPEYLEKNPLHTIPVLEDDDFILFDSHAIMIYLAETYAKDESWYPKDIKKRALVNQKLFFDTSILFPRIRAVTYPIMVEGSKIIEQKKIDVILEAFGFVEEFLSRTTYIAADHITIADVAALSTMTALEIIVPVEAEKFPKTFAWLTKLKEQPYCKKQNEPGATWLSNIIAKCLAS
uniref:Glutathione S-transferase n=1 Tax=Mythimna separata TaxID=271217 RepID=A0A9E9GE99_MYTSE|nr:glutathione S-transferase [Mythimna separata]